MTLSWIVPWIKTFVSTQKQSSFLSFNQSFFCLTATIQHSLSEMFFPYQQKQNVFHYLVLDNKKAVYNFTERVVWTLKLIWRIEKKYEMYVWPEWIEAKSYVFFFGCCCWKSDIANC